MFIDYISKRDDRRPEIRVVTGCPAGTTFFAIRKGDERMGMPSFVPCHTHRGWIIKQEQPLVIP